MPTRKLFIIFGIVCGMAVSFHLGTVWATHEIYSSIDAIHEDVEVFNAAIPHKTKDYRIMDKYR